MKEITAVADNGMVYEYFIFQRDDDLMIVKTLQDNDPLYGRGSWDRVSGPHPTEMAAEIAADSIAIAMELAGEADW